MASGQPSSSSLRLTPLLCGLEGRAGEGGGDPHLHLLSPPGRGAIAARCLSPSNKAHSGQVRSKKLRASHGGAPFYPEGRRVRG